MRGHWPKQGVGKNVNSNILVIIHILSDDNQTPLGITDKHRGYTISASMDDNNGGDVWDLYFISMDVSKVHFCSSTPVECNREYLNELSSV